MTLPTRFAAGLAVIGLPFLAATPAFAQAAATPTLNSGDTAWMLMSSALVLLMIVPGLALFYGGLVRSKNMLSLLTQIATLTAIAILVWVGWGYSLAFIDGNPVIGGFDKAFLLGIKPDTLSGTIPEYVFVCFQMTFAAITVALAIGSLAERVKFSALMLFGVLWLTIVYVPLAHMVWSSTGYFFKMGALDYAGGTVVHINAGIAGLVGCLFLGKRIGYQKEILAPHSMTNTLIGTGLLWVGWFGFNAGSALAANGAAGLAMINTFVATAAALVAWLVSERVAGHKPTLLGACSGAVAGLVAVTPAAGNAGPLGAIVLGAVASACCFCFVVTIKPKLGFDDALDVFGIHGIGGIVGSLGTALAYAPMFGGPGKTDYLILPQLGVQAYAVGVAIAWSAIGSAIVYAIVKAVIGLRVSPDIEREGLDLGEHGERAYNY
jgi:Amt family ammonium transporter